MPPPTTDRGEPVDIAARPPRRRADAPPWARRLLIGLAAGYFAVIVVLPVAALIHGAVFSTPPADRPLFDPPLVERPAPAAPGSRLWSSEAATAFGLTLLAAAAAIVVNTVFGTILAWVLVRKRFPGRAMLNGLIDLPFAVSPVVAGYMLLLLYGRGGWLAGLTDALGVPVAFALPGVLLATGFVGLPFVVRELVPVLEELGEEEEQAAATLGAGPLTAFFRVTLPGLKWGLLYGAVLTGARALGEYGAVAVVGGAVTGRTETATLFIDRMLLERDQPTAYAASLLLVGISVVFLAGLEFLKRR
jgi:sulfate transport system permease protein